MAVKKPRNKPRVERQIRLPMTTVARDKLRFQIHGIVSAVIHELTPDSFNRCCTYVSIVARAVANETKYRDKEQQKTRLQQFNDLILMADGIYQRFDATGELNITEAEKDGYRKAAAAVDGMLNEVDYSTFVIAKHQIYGEMAEKGIELPTL